MSEPNESPLVSNSEVECKPTFMSSYLHLGREVSSLSIDKRWFHEVRSFLVMALIIVSSTGMIDSEDISNSFVRMIFTVLDYISISPKILDSASVEIAMISTLIVVNILILMYSFGLILAYYFGKTPSYVLVRLWIMINRLIVPLPSLFIGKYIGYYSSQLAQNNTNLDSYVPQIFMVLALLIIWGWNVYLNTSIYNMTTMNIQNDIAQIWPEYINLEHYLTYLPCVYSAFFGFFGTLLPKFETSIFFVIVTTIVSISYLVIIYTHLPYINPTMNWRMSATFFSSFFVSFIPVFCYKMITASLAVAVIMIVLSVASFIWTKLITNYCSKNATDRTTEQQDSVSDYNHLATDVSSETPVKKPPFISIKKQDLLILLYFAVSLVAMVLVNALAAQRIPEVARLPDVIHDKFPIAKTIRESHYFGSFQYSNIICIITGVLLVGSVFFAREIINVRKLLIIYGTLCLVRTLSFLITSLPAPCQGLANCPCSDPEELSKLRAANPVKIAMSWLFGLGMFLSYPQCGDLIISGHTMYLWLATRGIIYVFNRKFPNPFGPMMSGAILELVVAGMIYIVIARNHYSIDVWFGFLFTEFLWLMYSHLESLAKRPSSKSDSFIVKAIRWIEFREIPLISDPEPSDDEE